MRRILVYNRKILKPKNPVLGRCFPIPWDRKGTRSLHVSMEDFGFYHANPTWVSIGNNDQQALVHHTNCACLDNFS